MTIVGFVLALWATTGAMTTYMTALNLAYERKDGRSFLRKRLVAVEMVAVIGVRVPARGRPPHLRAAARAARRVPCRPALRARSAGSGGSPSGRSCSRGSWLRSRRSSTSGRTSTHPRWRFITPGSVFATVVWLAVSGAFAVYTSSFGSYNKTWGSLAAVIVMLTWLWLAGDRAAPRRRDQCRDRAEPGAARRPTGRAATAGADALGLTRPSACSSARKRSR